MNTDTERARAYVIAKLHETYPGFANMSVEHRESLIKTVLYHNREMLLYRWPRAMISSVDPN